MIGLPKGEIEIRQGGTGTTCAECGKGGGTLRFRAGRGDYAHIPQCMSGGGVRDSARSVFPYVTSNIAGPGQAPIEVQSLRHLRRLEREHGVNSVPFNQDRF